MRQLLFTQREPFLQCQDQVPPDRASLYDYEFDYKFDCGHHEFDHKFHYKFECGNPEFDYDFDSGNHEFDCKFGGDHEFTGTYRGHHYVGCGGHSAARWRWGHQLLDRNLWQECDRCQSR